MARLDGEWWATVIHQFQMHVREEVVFLEAYERLVDDTDDEAVRFLLQLILADERRHHALFEQLAETATSSGEGEPVPAAPRLDRDRALQMLEPTERFLAAEREDGKHLAALRRDLKPLRDDTLWPLLVELMEMDTAKHVRILEYLRDHLRKAAT